MNHSLRKLVTAATLLGASFVGIEAEAACGGRGRVSRPSYAPRAITTPVNFYRGPHVPSPVSVMPIATTSIATSNIASSTIVASNVVTSNVVASKPEVVSAPQASVLTPSRRENRPAVRATIPVAGPKAKDSAESSALAALASLDDATSPSSPSDIPTFQAAAASRVAPHLGVWRTLLPNRVMIVLSLDEAGTFSWRVHNEGRVTEFDGRYEIEAGRLSLIRARDDEQMNGRWLETARGFEFHLDGEDTILGFSRQ